MLKHTRIFGLICILASGAASAQPTATSAISNFSYELIDLNPNDGVAASLSWQALAPEGHRSNSMAFVLGNTPGGPGYASEYENGTRPLQAVSASTITPRGSASASIIGALGREVTLHTSVASVYEPGANDFLRWTEKANGLLGDVRSIAFNTLSPVSDPPSWMMLLAGLGIAGFENAAQVGWDNKQLVACFCTLFFFLKAILVTVGRRDLGQLNRTLRK